MIMKDLTLKFLLWLYFLFSAKTSISFYPFSISMEQPEVALFNVLVMLILTEFLTNDNNNHLHKI